MNKIKLYVLLFASIFLVACSNNENGEIIEPITNSSEITFNTIPVEEAQQQAIEFLKEMNSVTRSVANEEVASVYAWRSDDISKKIPTTRSNTIANILPDTMLYIVNFGTEGGYVLVSADAKRQGVVAYIESGSLTPSDEIDNPGFQLFLDELRDGYFRLDPDSLHPINIPGMWENVQPMLQTRWGQNAPYNNNCYTSNGQQALAGCAAVAIGQIVAYHQYPTSYNGHSYDWSSILQSDVVSESDTIASNSVANLIHDIGVLIGMNYGVNGSSAYFSNTSNCWINFGYTYQNNDSLTVDIIESLKMDLPVYIRGTRYDDNGAPHGHAWVIDGSYRGLVRELVISPNGIPKYKHKNYNFVHCNWGWDGNNNGFFLFGEFNKKYNFSNFSIEDGYRAYNYFNKNTTYIAPDL